MGMNEKTFQQILSLHAKGLGEDASLLGILQLIYGHEDHREAVKWIKKFYHSEDMTLSICRDHLTYRSGYVEGSFLNDIVAGRFTAELNDDRTPDMVAVDALKAIGVDPAIAINIVTTKGRVLDFTKES